MNASTAAADVPSTLASAFAAAYSRELGQSSQGATADACLRAAALACRELLQARWTATQERDRRLLAQGGQRRVHYLSMEFLMGRALGNALSALGLQSEVRRVLGAAGHELGDVLEREADAALGNGGLGRLAACFLDSFAELGLPSFGYGLRYRYGMFAQQILDGRQVEAPDDWMREGTPWDHERVDIRYVVGFGGRVVTEGGRRAWLPAQRVLATAWDFIVPALHGEQVSTLRQWQAQAEQPIELAAFARGELASAARAGTEAESLNWVLYPDDSTAFGRELRLKQEMLLVSASLQDLLARHLREHGELAQLGKRNAIHLNDTHPALAPAELMRLLLDEHGLDWDEAWAITRQAVSYTNHTLMPEALETWPLRLFEELLPRHLEIIYEINHRFLAEVRRRFPDDTELAARVSLIDESGERRVRMASLAVVASQHVNGVSALHSRLMVETIFVDFARIFPERFDNVTNGVTPRRWLMQANPGLSALIDTRIGSGWRSDLNRLAELGEYADDPAFGAQLLAVRRDNKLRLAARVRRELGIALDPDTLFDVQAKRIHEYKRQLLNLLHVVARYQAIVANPGREFVPRTVIMAGKAASAYRSAKLIIQLAHDIARVVNSDPRVAGRLQLLFLPNYGVSVAESLMPAADLSEQISLAGTEASGTGNMKFALNGALTIGTWDGANIEMAEAIGAEQLFVFGLRAEDVRAVRALGYDPKLHVEENHALRAVLEAIAGGAFSPGDERRYRPLTDALLSQDDYLLLADFASYLQAQARVDALYADPAAWAACAWRNIAGMGLFSADRTVAEYARPDLVGAVRLSAGAPETETRMLAEADIQALLEGRHGDPFAVLGLHPAASGLWFLRALLPGARAVQVLDARGRELFALSQRHAHGLFEARVPRRRKRFDYRLRVQWADGSTQLFADAYAFGAQSPAGALEEFRAGRHPRPYLLLGAHPLRVDGVEGVRFAVWAPNARRASVVGDFNGWDGRRLPMRFRHEAGVWEIFVPQVQAGAHYKFELTDAAGELLPLKADPYAFAAELRPATASIIAGLPAPAVLPAARAPANRRDAPVSIYEVHAPSWRREGEGFPDWDFLASTLPAYAASLGFTHVELMPVSEHPFDGSWGYQALGLYAPSARFGDPQGLLRFVRACHDLGLGVLLDWVPAHFPSDAHGLARFDGSALYEYADPREGFHRDWNTLIYDYGRNEVRSFLAGNALYWLERHGVDGLRVDAVASMLYRDYSRPEGEWLPNVHGGNQNLEAISLLQRLNERVGADAPGTITVAEESTAFPGVSHPTSAGGLGFHYKWNMGWMNDTLAYMREDPIHRRWHHGKMGFGLVYAFSENFVLPLSHDEVVHGKGSLLGKMPGDDWQRFANLRAYYGFMWGHPGKKLLFMGQEFAQPDEWNHDASLPWQLLAAPAHAGVQRLVRDLNQLYAQRTALHALDCEPAGFEWLVADDAAQSIFCWLRRDANGNEVIVMSNFTPEPRRGYRLGLPAGAARWQVALDSDDVAYGGCGAGPRGQLRVEAIASHGRACSLLLDLPPLATVFLVPA